MRRLVLAMTLAAVLLLAPAAADGATVFRVGWNETARSKGAPVMNFKVRTIVLRPSGRWTVNASFKNLSARTFPIRRKFQLRVYESRRIDRRFSRRFATRFVPAMPTSVAPGQAWSGRFTGSGYPPSGYLRVVFGRFEGSGVYADWTHFLWVTDHTRRWRRPS